MIEEIYFHYPKPGHWDDLVALVKAEMKRSPGPHIQHLYSRYKRSNASFATVREFESDAERKEYWADWYTDPGTAAFREKYAELADRHYTSEIWELIE